MNRRELKRYLEKLRRQTSEGTFETNRSAIHINRRLNCKLFKSLNTLPKGARVLEVGVGKGRTLADLRTLYPHLHFYGTNYYSEGKNPTNEVGVAHAEGSRLPYQNNFFDYVFSAQVVQYIPDKVKHVEELHRVLKIGGKAHFYHDGLFAAWVHENGANFYVRPDNKPGTTEDSTNLTVSRIEMTKTQPKLHFGLKLDLKRSVETPSGINSVYTRKKPKRNKAC